MRPVANQILTRQKLISCIGNLKFMLKRSTSHFNVKIFNITSFIDYKLTDAIICNNVQLESTNDLLRNFDL